MRRAFTLIELAFVTAVLVILLIAALPRFQATAQRLRIEQAVTQLTQTLRHARQLAVAEGRAIAWVWDARAGRSALAAVDASGSEQELAQRREFTAVLPAPLVLDMQVEGQEAGRIQFFPDGSSDAATLSVKQGDATLYTVTVHGATGQPCLAAGAAAC